MKKKTYRVKPDVFKKLLILIETSLACVVYFFDRNLQNALYNNVTDLVYRCNRITLVDLSVSVPFP